MLVQYYVSCTAQQIKNDVGKNREFGHDPIVFVLVGELMLWCSKNKKKKKIL